MLTVSPYLTTRRPSPTTVEYTVSTSPPPTLSFRLLLLLTHLLRILTGLSVLFVLYAKYLQSPYHTSTSTGVLFNNDFLPDPVLQILNTLTTSTPGTIFASLASRTPLTLLIPLSSALLYLLLQRPHTHETLLILRGLGIQTSTSSPTYLSSSTTRFIPTEKVQDILVNEAFRGWEVRYLLVVVVEGERELVVVFPRLLPGREVVEKVWRGGRACLGFVREGAGAAAAAGKGENEGDGKERAWDRRDSAGFTGVGAKS